MLGHYGLMVDAYTRTRSSLLAFPASVMGMPLHAPGTMRTSATALSSRGRVHTLSSVVKDSMTINQFMTYLLCPAQSHDKVGMTCGRISIPLIYGRPRASYCVQIILRCIKYPMLCQAKLWASPRSRSCHFRSRLPMVLHLDSHLPGPISVSNAVVVGFVIARNENDKYTKHEPGHLQQYLTH